MHSLKSNFGSLFLGILLLIFACGTKEETCELDQEILSADIEVKIERLEDDFFTASSPEDFFYLMENHPEFTKNYLQPELYLSQDSLVSSLIQIHQDSAMVELYGAVKQEIPDLTSIERDLENAFNYIKHYFPDFEPPKVYTFVSGFNSDLMITDELIVIGLDYFLPITHPFQPDLPRYMADRYDLSYLIPMIITAMSSQFNEVNLQDQTLLAEMIYFGKAYHFTKTILPCAAEGLIIGYTEDEVGEIYSNEEYIWSHFVENELLYETNPFEIQKYLGEAPSTDAISTKAPGRIGRWLGWNIVDDYQISNGISLEDLMAEKDAEKVFRQSGYRPRGLE